MTEKPPNKRWGSGRVAFLAHLEEIKTGLRQGFSMRVIYEQHQNELGIGYVAFTKMVRRYASDARPAFHNPAHPNRDHARMIDPPPSAPPPPAAKPSPQGTPDAPRSEQGSRFHSNPQLTPARRRAIFGDE